VTAITHCTLLTLDESAFQSLVRSTSTLAAAVRESAEKRGVKIDLAALAATDVPSSRRKRWGFRSRRGQGDAPPS
jgi:monovalent cation:H+ antiporter, CPA1 family